MSQNTIKLQADWNRHYAALVESYKYPCVVDKRALLSFIYLYLQNALALLDLYLQGSLSLHNPTPSKLIRVKNMKVDSSYSYYACRGHC